MRRSDDACRRPLPNMAAENEIIIVEYDARWPGLFAQERDLILSRIGRDAVAIEHIGSTAVPGLGAKPIIDIMIAVRRLADAERCIKPLAAIHYEYVPGHEAVTPERRYFHKGTSRGRRTHHLHMVERDSDFWRRHLLFRDFLRAHPAEAQQYYRLKRELAQHCGADREAYTEAKTSFIKACVERARFGEQRLRPACCMLGVRLFGE
jgi:GrpB-like predicted nucleotidyltransferase (UPF0157 family)